MDEMTHKLKRLGRTVADGLESSSDAMDLQKARSRFLAAGSPSPKPTKRIVASLLLATACAAALGVYVVTRPPAISFAIGSPPATGIVGDWISSGDLSTELRFSEGTAVDLAPGARIRVTETNSSGAAVLIEKGGLHAKITHTNQNTRWAFHAGPFQVRVTGTEFDASWDPTTETFEMTMNQGSVFATGPLLRDGRNIVAGERLRVFVRENKLEILGIQLERKASVETNTASTNHVPDVAVSSASEAESTPVLNSTNHSETSPRSAVVAGAAPQLGSSSEPDWRSLASSGKYKDALAAAERTGFSQEVGRANASELLALADAARLAGSPTRGREALLAARTRFGVRGRTAFLIGKIAADQQGSAGDAASWFETYLREEPGGQLAEQALGRLLEINRRRDINAARSLANRYLAKYPQGAYAALARSILEP